MENNVLLIIGYVWPEPKSSAAGSRMLQLINAFISNDYHVTFASPCAKTENAFDLASIGVYQEIIELNSPSFNKFLERLNPNVVMFDRFMMEEQFGWRVAETCPNAIRILDTEDLHFLRKGRHQAFKDGKLFDKSYLHSDVAKREIASIYRCDLSLIISKAEIKILKEDFKIDDALLLYLPFMLNEILEEAILKLPKFKAREHFVTIGNFLHEPNYNAVLYLKETIWPLIRKQLPKAKLHIYGAYVSEKVHQLHNDAQGFLVKGFAEDVNHIMQNAKVCLAPIRFGAGLKGKLVDAMQNGTPMVTTAIGAEGMVTPILASGCIEDSPEDFAKIAVKLYVEETLWNEKHTNSTHSVMQFFDKKKYQGLFLNRVDVTIKNLKAIRTNNFTGQLLMHHTLQSTKYLSKWIEAKQK
ncbi:glycosyltransferase family 4 protein [Flavobacteriaceae bacterium MHTCC 0001]